MNTEFYQQLIRQQAQVERSIADLKKELIPLQEEKAALDVLVNRYKSKANEEEEDKYATMSLPAEYDESLHQAQKTYNSLLVIGRGYYNEVADVLKKREPGAFPDKRAIKVAQIYLSQLARAGRIGAIKSGKGNEYFILDSDPNRNLFSRKE